MIDPAVRPCLWLHRYCQSRVPPGSRSAAGQGPTWSGPDQLPPVGPLREGWARPRLSWAARRSRWPRSSASVAYPGLFIGGSSDSTPQTASPSSHPGMPTSREQRSPGPASFPVTVGPDLQVQRHERRLRRQGRCLRYRARLLPATWAATRPRTRQGSPSTWLRRRVPHGVETTVGRKHLPGGCSVPTSRSTAARAPSATAFRRQGQREGAELDYRRVRRG